MCLVDAACSNAGVRDLIGHSLLDEERGGRNSEVINIVVGGTGDCQGAAGVSVGTTDGHGRMTNMEAGPMLPASILALKEGYIHMPLASKV